MAINVLRRLWHARLPISSALKARSHLDAAKVLGCWHSALHPHARTRAEYCPRHNCLLAKGLQEGREESLRPQLFKSGHTAPPRRKFFNSGFASPPCQRGKFLQLARAAPRGWRFFLTNDVPRHVLGCF